MSQTSLGKKRKLPDFFSNYILCTGDFDRLNLIRGFDLRLEQIFANVPGGSKKTLFKSDSKNLPASFTKV